jgi:PAS domain S-box-containing protein
MPLLPRFDAYAPLVLLAAFISLFLSAYSWFGVHRETARPFSLLQFSIFLWCFSCYLGLRVESPLIQLFYLKLEFVGIICVPFFALVFALALARKPLGRGAMVALAVIPAISVFLVLSNLAGRYFWNDPRLGIMPFLRAKRGPWYYVHAVYSYLLLASSFFFLVKKALSMLGFQRRFFLHISAFLAIPLIANVGFVFFAKSARLDPTPLSFILSGLLLANSLRRYDIFDALPYAREIAFSSLRVPLVTVDGEGYVVGSNLDAKRIFGLSGTFGGYPLSKLCPEAVTAISGGVAVDWDLDGRNYLIRAFIPEGKKKAWKGSIVIFEDVTERVEAMKAINEREESLRRYEFMVNASRDFMTLVNREHRYEAANDAFCERYNLRRDKIIGAKVEEVWDQSAIEQFFAPGFEACFRGEYPVVRRVFDFGPPLGKRQMDLCFNPYRSPSGEITHAVIVSKDVTDFLEAQRELKEARERADAANAAKSSFLAAMSHEIRTPLNAVLGLTELTLKSDLDPEQRDNLETVYASGNRLLNLINDILDLSKIEAGRMSLERMDFDLPALLAETLKPFKLVVAEKKLNLYLAVEGGAPRYVAGDPLRLGQIVTNLVGNAVKFTDYGGITVTLSPAPEDARPKPASDLVADPRVCGVRISVRDTGIGIPADKQAFIFESFSQADPSVARHYGGTGLGLSLCRTLAGLFGGTIGVESTPGEGSVFSFTAFFERGDPERVKPGSIERPLPEESPFGRPSLAVLLVEDSQVNAKVAMRWLSREGHRVTLAESGEAAIRALKVRGYDVVLMDIEMGGMDGFEAARQIRSGAAGAKYRGLPIVAMSAHSGAEFREAVNAAGMDDYVAKPIDFFELSAALARVVRAATRELIAAGLPSLLAKEKAEGGLLIDEVGPMKRLGGDRDLYYEILGIFADEAQERAASIAMALARDNREDLRRLAHGLRGSAKTIGANALAAVAAVLEAGTTEGGAEKGAIGALAQAELEALVTKLLELFKISTERARALLPPDQQIPILE